MNICAPSRNSALCSSQDGRPLNKAQSVPRELVGRRCTLSNPRSIRNRTLRGCCPLVSTVVAILALLFVAAAQPSTASSIRFYYLKSATPGENSALSGECDGTTSSAEITCRFTQIMVAYKLDPLKLPAELEKRLVQLRAEATKDPKNFANQMCGELRKSRGEVERKLLEGKNARTKASIQDFLSVCANPSLEAVEGLMGRITLAESKTCAVSVFQNDPVTYKRVAPNKWVANVGPHGVCSSVYLYTLENDPKHTNLWRWTQVRTYADRSTELCKDLQLNYKLEYSWEGEEPDLICETVSFGA